MVKYTAFELKQFSYIMAGKYQKIEKSEDRFLKKSAIRFFVTILKKRPIFRSDPPSPIKSSHHYSEDH